jgi:hypothetical protein
MRHRAFVFVGTLAVAVCVGSMPAVGQTSQGGNKAAQSAPLRTAWGDPDIQGIWDARIRVPFQRPRGETREFYTAQEVADKEKAATQREKTRQELIDRGEYVAIGERYFPVDPGIFRDGDAGVARDVKVSRRTSAIIDPPLGRLPPWTRAQMKRWEAREEASRNRGEADSWEDRALAERCITRFSPASAPPVRAARLALGERFDSGNATSRDSDSDVNPPIRRIMQFPGYVVITTLEIGHAGEGSYRIIPLDGRPTLGPSVRQWQGDSRGRWEGDTLVIDVSNFNSMQDSGPISPARTGAVYPGSGETLRVTERYRRTGPDALEYRVTVEDPATYIRPYTSLRDLTRDDGYEMQPFHCHEGHRSIGGAMAQARADEQTALEYGIESQLERFEKYEMLKKEWAELWPEWRESTR